MIKQNWESYVCHLNLNPEALKTDELDHGPVGPKQPLCHALVTQHTSADARRDRVGNQMSTV